MSVKGLPHVRPSNKIWSTVLREVGMSVQRQGSPQPQREVFRLITEVCPDFCVNGQVLFLGLCARTGPHFY